MKHLRAIEHSTLIFCFVFRQVVNEQLIFAEKEINKTLKKRSFNSPPAISMPFAHSTDVLRTIIAVMFTNDNNLMSSINTKPHYRCSFFVCWINRKFVELVNRVEIKSKLYENAILTQIKEWERKEEINS